MSDKKTIIKDFQSMKPSVAFKQLDFSKLPKEVRDKIKLDLSQVSNDTLDLQFDQSTFKKWVETFSDLYPAAFGIKEEKKVTPVVVSAPADESFVSEGALAKVGELDGKIKDLKTRISIIKKMILKQPKKRVELKIRLKTVEKMIVKFEADLKLATAELKAKPQAKKKIIKKSIGGLLFGEGGDFISKHLSDLKNKRKKIRFDLGGTMQGNKKYKYSVTFQTITPESAEVGDFESQGFEVEETIEELQDILQDAVNRYGVSEPSSISYKDGVGKVSSGCWWSSSSPDNDRDYFEKGIEKYYSLHIRNIDGSELSDEEAQFVNDKLKEGRNLHWDDEDNNWWREGGEIHSEDKDGILMFKADTKGGKYSIEVREGSNVHGTYYDIYEFTNGKSRGMGVQTNKELLMHKIIDTIIGSKKIDGINYIVSFDNINVKEYLPALEKIWDIYNSSEYREWFKKQNESLTEEQKQSLSDEIKNKTIKYVKDNDYKENDSTVGAFFNIFKKEKLIQDFYKSKGMVILKDGGDFTKKITIKDVDEWNVINDWASWKEISPKYNVSYGKIVSDLADFPAYYQNDLDRNEYEQIWKERYNLQSGDNDSVLKLETELWDYVLNKAKEDNAFENYVKRLNEEKEKGLLDIPENYDFIRHDRNTGGGDYIFMHRNTRKELKLPDWRITEMGGAGGTDMGYVSREAALKKHFSKDKYSEGGGVNQELSDIEIKELLTDFTTYISKSQQGIENSIDEYISRYNKGVFNETIDKNNLKATILISFYRFRYHDNFRQDLGVVTRFLNDYEKFKDGGKIKFLKSIEDETSLMPYVIAEPYAEKLVGDMYKSEFANWENLSKKEKTELDKKYKIKVEEISNYLVKRANITYTYNDKFRKDIQAKGNKGRDILNVFMEHYSGIVDGKSVSDIDTIMTKYAKESKDEKYFSEGGGVGTGFHVFNYTDNIYASPDTFKNEKEAKDFITQFRKRYEAQGYYKDNRLNKINPKDIDLEIIPEDFSPFKKGSEANVELAEGGSIGSLQKELDEHKELSFELYPSGDKMSIENGLYGILVNGKLRNTKYIGQEYCEIDGVVYKNDKKTKLILQKGGTIDSDRRFTDSDFTKLTDSKKFDVRFDVRLWKITESGRTSIVGKFNPKTKTLFIFGKKDNTNPLVKWLSENSFVSADEYDKLENGGGLGDEGEVIISTKKLNKYQKSRYNKEIINNISITDDGGIIVETDNNKKKFYTSQESREDIISNVDDWSGDYYICMIQDKEGVNVSKYENGGGLEDDSNKKVVTRVYSYKSFKEDGIDIFRYLRSDTKYFTLDQTEAKVNKEKDLLIPILKAKHPHFLILTGYDADMNEKFSLELFSCFIFSKFGEKNNAAIKHCEEVLSRNYRRTYDGYKKFNEGGSVEVEFPFKVTALNKEGVRVDAGEYVSKSAANKYKNMIDPKYKPKVEDNIKLANGGGIRSQKQYNKEVDSYNFYVLNTKTEKVESGFEHKQDAKDLLSDFENKEDYKVVSKLQLSKMGIENPNEKWKSLKNGGGLNSDNTPKVYIADLAAYNEGTSVGEWIDLSDFSSGEEVMDKIQELLAKWSEEQKVEREEYSVNDFENFPEKMYSDSMGEESFQKVIDYYEAVKDADYPTEVIEEYASQTGNDIADAVSNMNDAYQGKFSSSTDLAKNWVDSVGGIGGVQNPENYITVSDTDRRLVANEQADADIDNMDNEAIMDRADMRDEYDESVENEDDKKTERLLSEAKEIVHDEIYEEWYEGLNDPYNFLVEEQGIYDSSNIMNASFIMFDYDKFGEDLEQDYLSIDHDGETYYFLNS